MEKSVLMKKTRGEVDRFTRPPLLQRLEDKDGLHTSVDAAVGTYRKM